MLTLKGLKVWELIINAESVLPLFVSGVKKTPNNKTDKKAPKPPSDLNRQHPCPAHQEELVSCPLHARGVQVLICKLPPPLQVSLAHPDQKTSPAPLP